MKRKASKPFTPTPLPPPPEDPSVIWARVFNDLALLLAEHAGPHAPLEVSFSIPKHVHEFALAPHYAPLLTIRRSSTPYPQLELEYARAPKPEITSGDEPLGRHIAEQLYVARVFAATNLIRNHRAIELHKTLLDLASMGGGRCKEGESYGWCIEAVDQTDANKASHTQTFLMWWKTTRTRTARGERTAKRDWLAAQLKASGIAYQENLSVLHITTHPVRVIDPNAHIATAGRISTGAGGGAGFVGERAFVEGEKSAPKRKRATKAKK